LRVRFAARVAGGRRRLPLRDAADLTPGSIFTCGRPASGDNASMAGGGALSVSCVLAFRRGRSSALILFAASLCWPKRRSIFVIWAPARRYLQRRDLLLSRHKANSASFSRGRTEKAPGRFAVSPSAAFSSFAAVIRCMSLVTPSLGLLLRAALPAPACAGSTSLSISANGAAPLPPLPCAPNIAGVRANGVCGRTHGGRLPRRRGSAQRRTERCGSGGDA
jgi:hypothetical protein